MMRCCYPILLLHYQSQSLLSFCSSAKNIPIVVDIFGVYQSRLNVTNEADSFFDIIQQTIEYNNRLVFHQINSGISINSSIGSSSDGSHHSASSSFLFITVITTAVDRHSSNS